MRRLLPGGTIAAGPAHVAMPQFSFTTIATYAAQIITAFVVAILLFSFQRQYRKSYLRHWVAGWIALAIYHTVSLAGFALAVAYHLPARSPLRLVMALVAAVAGFAQIGWFAFGPYEILRRRPIREADSRRILIVLALVSVFTVVLFLDESGSSSARYVARVGVRAFLASIVFFAVAFNLWRARNRRN